MRLQPILLSRRRALAAGAVALAAPWLARPVSARPDDVEYAVRQDFGGSISPQDGMVKLEMPRHSDAGTSVPMTLSMDSPMTAEDYPATIRVYGSENPRPRIVTVHFTPFCGQAKFSTRIRLDGAQIVSAIAKTSTGALWQTGEKVGVAFGACANASDAPPLPPDWKPTTRVGVPKAIKPGEPFEVRTIISHPMETGLRLNARNQYEPLRIIETFTCRMNGKVAFSVELEPAIATNPYLAFQLVTAEPAQLDCEWLDTTGAVYRDEAAVALA